MTDKLVSEPAAGTTEEDVSQLIINHLKQNAPAGMSTEINQNTALLEGGLLDSLGILQLTIFLGEEMGVEIEDEDFVPENFGTVADLARFIVSKSIA